MGLEEILKQVEETGKEKAADIRKATVEEVEAKMAEASKAVSYTHLTLPTNGTV